MVGSQLGRHRLVHALILIVGVSVRVPSAAADDGPHTFDGENPIGTINLSVVYLVPKDRTPLLDWRERVDYFMRRIDPFHRRESGGKSKLAIHVHPEPLIVNKTAREVRGNDPDQTFDHSIRRRARP